MKGGYEAAKRIAELKTLPDCVFFASDTMVIGALKAFNKYGIRIPDDIEMISVGNGEQEMEEFIDIPVGRLSANGGYGSILFQNLLDVISGKVQPHIRWFYR